MRHGDTEDEMTVLLAHGRLLLPGTLMASSNILDHSTCSSVDISILQYIFKVYIYLLQELGVPPFLDGSWTQKYNFPHF